MKTAAILRAALLAGLTAAAPLPCVAPSAQLVVQVFDELENPIARADVFFHPAGSKEGFLRRPTDEQGFARFGTRAPDRKYEAIACATGFLSTSSSEMSLTERSSAVISLKRVKGIPSSSVCRCCWLGFDLYR